MLLNFFLLVAGTWAYAETRQKTEVPVIAAEEEDNEDSYEAESNYLKVLALEAEGKNAEAIELLHLMGDELPSSVLVRRASLYLKSGKKSEALTDLKEAVAGDVKNIRAYLMLGAIYGDMHDYDSSRKSYDLALKLDPKHEEALVLRAQVFIEQGKPLLAIQSLRAALKGNHQSPILYFYLGRAYEAAEKPYEAQGAYKMAYELKPAFTQAAFALAELLEEKDSDRAQVLYKTLYDESLDEASAEKLINIYVKKKQYAAALPILNVLIEKDHENLNLKIKLGLLQIETHAYDQAIITFQSILSSSPQADRARLYLATVYEKLKSFDQSIEELKKIHDDTEIWQEALLHAAYLLHEQKKLQEAEALLSEARRKDPKSGRIAIFLAAILDEQSKRQEAVAVLEGALVHDADSTQLHASIANLFDRAGQFDKSLQHMERVIKLDPQNVEALNYVGYTLAQKGIRLIEAEKFLKRAMSLQPQNPFIQDSLGWLYHVQGKTKQALVFLEKAAKKEPREPTILEHLADAYVQAHGIKKARLTYMRVLEYLKEEAKRNAVQEKLDALDGVKRRS